MEGQRTQTQVIDELRAEVDALINIIDNARHAAWRPGPKLEPVRQALHVPEHIRVRYEARKWSRHVAAGNDVPVSVRVGRANPLREEAGGIECCASGRCEVCTPGFSWGGV